MASRVQIPFSFNYPSGGNLVPAAGASIAVYVRNTDGSQGSPASVFQGQSGASQYSSLQTDLGGNVPGWVNEGTYKIVAAATGGFGGGVINFDALYGGGTTMIASNAVDVPQLSTSVQASLIPVGTILEHGGTVAPAGFLVCDGSVVSQTTYPALFSAIGTNWNVGGEAGGTFRLPNHIGATTIGAGTAAWGTVRTLGKYGRPSGGTYLGEETHTLSVGEIPGHYHNYSGNTGTESADHSHYYSQNTGYVSSDHSHTTYINVGNSTNVRLWDGNGAWGAPGTTYTGYGSGGISANHYHGCAGYTGGRSAAHSHAFSGTTDNGTPAGGVHNNMPPFAVVNKIIKY